MNFSFRFGLEKIRYCILCGRLDTHPSLNVDPTRPDRQPAMVNSTGFHLISAVCQAPTHLLFIVKKIVNDVHT